VGGGGVWGGEVFDHDADNVTSAKEMTALQVWKQGRGHGDTRGRRGQKRRRGALGSWAVCVFGGGGEHAEPWAVWVLCNIG